MTQKTTLARRNPRRPAAAKPRREDEKLAIKGALVGTVTASELADIVGLTDERLRQMTSEGMPKASRGRYPLRDASRWIFDRLRIRNQGRDAAGPSKADLERDLLLLKLKKARGEVFDRREVVDTLAVSYARLGNGLETLATRIGRELNLPGEDVKMVRDLVDEMRTRFVRDCAEYLEPADEDAGLTPAA